MLTELFNLVFPDHCVVCNGGLLAKEAHICTHCRINLPTAESEMFLQFPNPMELRIMGHLKFERAFSYMKFYKSGSAQRILHALKYQGMPEIGVLFGEWFGSQLMITGNGNYDLIVPVPLHSSRMLKRGYNQSAHICKGISKATGVEMITDVLVRKVATKTQTGYERSLRWKNVEHVFGLVDSSSFQNKRVLLVDDVVTTGATLISCGTALETAGIQSLSLACLAMAQ